MSRQPNVLMIMSDQHHRDFLGAAGHPHVQTPNLDQLAARGRFFSHAYCPFPLCGPSRASFMTGRQPHRTEVMCNSSEFRGDMPTFAHGFGAAGYETVLSGRMHFVGLDQRHGFEKRIIGDCPGSGYIAAGWQLKEVLGDLVDTPGMARAGLEKSGPGRSGYLTYDETVAQTTADFLRHRQDERPLMMVVGFVMPHCPFVADPTDFALYGGKLPMPTLTEADLAGEHPFTAAQRRRFGAYPVPDPVVQARVAAAYHGMVTHVDRQVGRVLAALADAGMAEDTIVVYTSDHGEQLGEQGCWWKSTFYNGSIGVPCIVAGPGVDPADGPLAANISLMDIGPTMLDMAGAAPIPATDGRSFRCLLTDDGDASAWPDRVYAEYCENSLLDGTPQRMVKQGPWKYVYYHGMPPQLFHDDDPRETTNLATDPAHAETLAELEAIALADWDPEAVAAMVRERRQQVGYCGQWGKANPNLLELDEPWFSGLQENYVNIEAANRIIHGEA